jgi:hypothetical protein
MADTGGDPLPPELVIDRAALSPVAQKLLDPAGPAPLRNLGARAIAPGLKPNEALTVCVLLAEGNDAIAETARTSLAKLPPPVVNGALSGALPPGVLHVVAPFYSKDADIATKLLNHANIHALTVVKMAAGANEAVAELIATNEERILACPEIIEKLYMNKATRMSTADRLIELAARNNIKLSIPGFEQAVAAIQGELIPEASEERTFDDQVFDQAEQLSQADTNIDDDTHEIDEMTGQEVVKEESKARATAWSDLNASGKVRRALLGDSKDRMLAIRDSNPVVREAAVKSPGLSENEVTRITANRNTTEDILRIIASDRDWVRAYQIKLNLVMNPRTPFAFGSRMISHLRESDLKKASNSRDVSGAIQNAVKQHLSRKTK